MPIAVSAAEAFANRRGHTFKEVIAKPFYRRLYMGSEPTLGGQVEAEKLALPQAYIVEQPANSSVHAHYHDTNQFQVFVHGGGSFGKKPVNGIVVHYARAHTPYGPIVAGDDGAHYLTLRNHWDSGAKAMPENRDKLRKIKRVHRVADHVQIPDASALKSIATEKTDLVPLEEDGLGIRQFDIGPGQDCTIALETDGAGAYAFVVGGSIFHDGTELETHSLIYRGPDDVPLAVMAGTEGASVLLLQFPPEPPTDAM